MRIIGPASADPIQVAARIQALPNVHPRFVAEMFTPLWTAAQTYGIDPVGVVAQAYKETGRGTFLRPDGKQGAARPEFYNTAGIKVRHQPLTFPEYPDPNPLLGDKPLAHQMFPSWEVGATAHVQHLRAYAGWPVEGLIVDPRYVYVIGKHWVEHFAELGGKWAPALSYGTEIESIMRQLQGK